MNATLKLLPLAVGAMIACLPAARAAQDNVSELSNFRQTGNSQPAETIAQTGKTADALRENLKQIKVPPGFKIELYAVVPEARHMAIEPSTGVVFVGTRKNRVLGFPAAQFFGEGGPDVAAAVVLAQGKLIPTQFESFNHGARACRIGPDKKLYIALGQPWNVPPKDKLAELDRNGLAGIIRVDQDGKNREVYAHGVRNSVGLDFNPKDKTLWFTDNQVDGMGDDTPPGELDRATKAGENFGFPWYGGGKVRTVEYKDQNPPAGVVYPQVEFAAHAADLGMSFYSGKSFPQKYQGGIFVAEHGSWNRTKPIGARVMYVPVKDDGTAGEAEVFAEGWLTQSGEYMGRPVDVQMLQDGSLLVSDDYAGAIYRISYSGAK